MARIHQLADDLVLIDTNYLHTPDAIGVYLLRGRHPALIETGPTSTVETLLDGIRQSGEDPGNLQALIVTHIHLDHAGAAGALVRRFSHLHVYVHPVGAPHLADPSRLLTSAARLYGDELARLFGEVVPVPADHLHVLEDGTAVAAGDRTLVALDTPGHARHHLAFFDEATGDLFTGDVAGVALPGSRYVRPPTPPPELDIPAWERSLIRIRALRPRRLLLTHFGAHDWVDGLLAQLETRLHAFAGTVRKSLEAGLDEPSITARFREDAVVEIERLDGPGSSARYEVIMPIRQSVQGLIRYITKDGI